MKNITRISATAAVLASLAVGAHAQTTVFSTDGGVNQLGTTRNAGAYSTIFGQGIGYTTDTSQPNEYYSKVNGSGGVSPATSLGEFDSFSYTGPTIAGPISIAVHGNAYSDAAGFGTLGIINVYANIFLNTGTLSAPVIGTAVAANILIPFTSYANTNDTGDHLFTSASTGITSMVSGSNYIIAFDPRSTGSSSDAMDAVVDLVQNTSGTFSETVSNADSTSTDTGAIQTGQIGFRILQPAIVPEPSQFVTFGLGIFGLGAAIIKRRRSA